MIICKRTLLLVLFFSTLLFLCYQLYSTFQPLFMMDTETRYTHLVDQYQVLKMERLVLEQKCALAKARSQLFNTAPINNSVPKNLTALKNGSGQESIALSLDEAKTFEQLEAYVSNNKPLQPQALTNDEKFILAASANDFTLQLLGVRDEHELKRFVSEKNLKDARIIHTYYLNKDWYVLVYGMYKNHAEALKAIDSLPSEIKNQKPWIRQLASLQKAIKIYRN